MAEEMRLIDANKLKAEFEWLKSVTNESSKDEVQEVIQRIDNAPTVDAAPIVHGHWEDKPTGRYGAWQSWCSVCGKHSGIGGIESNRHRAYCPNCGAKMD